MGLRVGWCYCGYRFVCEFVVCVVVLIVVLFVLMV